VPRDAIDLADANLLQALREHARWQIPSELREENGLLLVAGPNALPVAFRNFVARVDREVPAGAVLERARRFFSGRERAFAVVVRMHCDADLDEAARAAGLTLTGDSACMLRESPLPEPAIPADIRIERFASEAHVRHAVQVNAEAYEAIKLPAQETRIFFGRPEALLAPSVIGFVAYRGDVPVSTALAILSGKGAGVYWVGTARGEQRRGLGDVLTRLATNAAFAAGAGVVALQASVFGEPLYARLGFRTYDRLRRYRTSPAV
jgi:ribosomal protein S18 acetylase RimI-like enzyme